jgi:cellulose synthase/poly-beta-1,6-N-acetylglucosamine synthase-like glycosyltransferase
VYINNKFILLSFVVAFILLVFLVYRFRTHRKIIGHIIGGVFIITSTYLLIWVIIQLQAAYILNPFFYFFIVPAGSFLFFILSAHVLQAAYVAGEPKKFASPVIGKEFSFVNPTGKVSIHIPCRNEDPNQIICLVSSCLSQTYKNFEIIIIDNNTKDAGLWKPVKDFADLDPRVKFFHYETLSGFKAGALNMALKQTATDAFAIAVLDADYRVSPCWLEKTLPYLNGKTVVVQAPQDYRVSSGSLFERLSILEAKIFFEVGMKMRAQVNAIIQHGTMCLIDKKVLVDVGGWSTETIVEDAELGLRILEHGFNAVYVPVVLGQGIAPQNFNELTRQRFRWAFGSVQILKHYFKLFFWKSGLSLKQRFNFIAGWVFWWLHLLYPVFIAISVVATYFLLIEIRHVPISELSYLLFYYLVWVIIVNFVIYRKLLKATFKDLLLLLVFGASLTHVLVKAVLFGLFTSRYPFLNTRGEVTLVQKIKDWGQFILGFCLSIFVFAQILDIYFTYGLRRGDLLLWQLTLVLISLPSIAALVVIAISYLSRETKRY